MSRTAPDRDTYKPPAIIDIHAIQEIARQHIAFTLRIITVLPLATAAVRRQRAHVVLRVDQAFRRHEPVRKAGEDHRDLGDRFILHHDYALDDDGNIVSLATDLTRSDHAVQDQAIKVNTSTGKVTKLVDFGEMFPDYKASTGHSGIDESDPTASGRWDWIHLSLIHI